MISLFLLAACDRGAEHLDTGADAPAVVEADTDTDTDTAAEFGDTAPADTGGEALDTGEPEADTGTADQVYAHDCDDGSAASYSYRFPVRFEVGTRPEAGLWTVYDPAYVAWYADTYGLDVASAAYTESVGGDADGYAVAYCAWFEAAGYRGFMVARVELLVGA